MKRAVQAGLLDQEVVHEQLAADVDVDHRRRRDQIGRTLRRGVPGMAPRRPRRRQRDAVVERFARCRLRGAGLGPEQRSGSRVEKIAAGDHRSSRGFESIRAMADRGQARSNAAGKIRDDDQQDRPSTATYRQSRTHIRRDGELSRQRQRAGDGADEHAATRTAQPRERATSSRARCERSARHARMRRRTAAASRHSRLSDAGQRGTARVYWRQSRLRFVYGLK